MDDTTHSYIKNLIAINNPSVPAEKTDPISEETKLLKEQADVWLKRSYSMADFLDLINAINSKDRFKEIYGTIGLRKILSEQGPPIQPVIDANLVPTLIKFMRNTKEPHLQLEAAWALTNVASGTSQQTQAIIDQGGLPCFIQLLKSPHPEVAEQGIWAIGNIAGDSSTFRDLILKYGGLDPLIQIVNKSTSSAIIKHGTWAISNLCRGKPLPDFKFVDSAIPTLAKVMEREDQLDVLTDASWALSYLSNRGSPLITAVAPDLIPALIKHVNDPNPSLSIPCLRTLGNITENNREQDMALANPSYLPKLFQLVGHRSKAVRREVCWVLSNITAGTSEHIEAVIKNHHYVDILIRITANDNAEVRREAAYVLSNATKTGTLEQIASLVELGVLDCFLNLMTSPDAKTVEVVLEGVANILNPEACTNMEEKKMKQEFLEMVEAKGGIRKIEDLQSHPDDDIYIKAYTFLETYCDLESIAEV